MEGKAYEKLKFYQNICEIRRLIAKVTKCVERKNIRLANQMRDAARSAKQNIRESYLKDTAAEFSRGIKISRGSLGELEGDIDDCFEDALIDINEYTALKTLMHKTCYQLDRYLDSLYNLVAEGKWKTRFKK